MEYRNREKNVKITAKALDIGYDIQFGNNISVTVKGVFKIGDYSRLGGDCDIKGNNVIFGKHLFNSSGLRIGGGGRQHPNANFTIGDRCTIHNNFINICEPVKIGDDVGLSPDVSIVTHGYWLSVLEGYPASFAGVTIGNGVIVGYRSLIMMGVNIRDNIVIGANSVVTKNLTEKGVYVGSPAKKIKDIVPLTKPERIKILNKILDEYLFIAKYHDIQVTIFTNYPWVKINDFRFNVETFMYEGIESKESDDMRDYIRKWGIRIYTERPFKSAFSFTT